MPPLLLRELKRKPNSWIEPRIWPPAPDLPADRLVDLDTSSNKLSVFSCESEKLDKAKITVAAALIAKRNTVRDLDWVVISLDDVKKAGYDIVLTPKSGNSADADVNKGHFDIRNLTARAILKLLEMLTPKLEPGELPRRESVLSLSIAQELKALEAEKGPNFVMTDDVRKSADEILGESPEG